MTPRSDEACWLRARDGDSAAFVELYDAHRNRVFGHAVRLLGNSHDAEDVTAVAFLHLWRRRADVRIVDGSVLPWLLVTTGNAARNVTRSTRRHRRLLDRLPRDSDARSAEDLAGGSGFSPDLAAAIQRLGATDRALVGLVVLEDVSIDDAAHTLDMTPGAVKTRMYRIRQRLRTQLSDADVPVTAAPEEAR